LFNIGPEEIILILVLALIVFGPKRLPEIGRTVGKSLREFRRASDDIRQELSLHLDDEPEAAPGPAPTTQLPAATTNGDGPAPEEHSAHAPDSGSVP
jgi:sec-independent protein translocase protein TatA